MLPVEGWRPHQLKGEELITHITRIAESNGTLRFTLIGEECTKRVKTQRTYTYVLIWAQERLGRHYRDTDDTVKWMDPCIGHYIEATGNYDRARRKVRNQRPSFVLVRRRDGYYSANIDRF